MRPFQVLEMLLFTVVKSYTKRVLSQLPYLTHVVPSHDPDGIKVDVLKQVKEVERASLTRYVELVPTAKYVPVSEYPEGKHLVLNCSM